MPLNSIPATTSVDALHAKVAEASGNCYVDLGFWGGVVPGNTAELSPMYSEGVVGFKCFLVDSGVAEFPNVAEENLRAAMTELTRLGALLIVHAEMPGPIEHACTAVAESNLDPRQYQTFLRSRPAEAEDAAVNLIVRLSRELGTRVHIVHHSSAGSLSAIRDAKAEGLNITAETCPHYLAFAAEEIPDGATQFKCCPPIRERANRDALWEALRNGTIDMVVSDHSPCPPEMKELETGDFMRAWGGISSLQFRLPVIWSLARARNIDFSVLAKWLCSAPANLVGLGQKKGQISAGYDADLVIWNPEAGFVLTEEQVLHRHKLSPYLGQQLYGAVEATYLRGERIYSEKGIEEEPRGELLMSGKL
jgi:allantoinase